MPVRGDDQLWFCHAACFSEALAADPYSAGKPYHLKTMGQEVIFELLCDLCSKSGFCTALHNSAQITSRSNWMPREFALAVLRAEGFPNYQTEYENLRFIAHEFRKRADLI